MHSYDTLKHTITIFEHTTCRLLYSDLPRTYRNGSLTAPQLVSDALKYGVCVGTTDSASLIYRSTTSLIVAMPFSPTYYWLTIGLQIVHHTLS